MRNALSDVATVTDIDTDTSSRKCSFKVDLTEVDIATKLNEFSQSNKHIRGWSVWNES